MAQTINAPRPDPPSSGESLMKGSVSGRKTQFVNNTETVTASSAISAGGTLSLIAHITLWSLDLPEINQVTNNIIQPDNALCLFSSDIYVDNDLNRSYMIQAGSLLSSGQHKVVLSFVQLITPATISGSIQYTAEALYNFTNNDTVSHTIYAYVGSKYITYGEDDL